MDQNKDIKRYDETPNALKNHSGVSFFEKDTFFVYIFKKTERLVSAVYLISDFFSDQEPIKWSTREICIDLLSLIAECKNTLSATKRDALVFEIRSCVLKVLSMFSIAHVSGLISEMNFSILEKEFNSLILNLGESSSHITSHKSPVLSDAFFDHEESPAKQEIIDKRQINPIRQNAFSQGQTNKKKDSRSKTILDIVKRKKEVTIKDISDLIKDCSEKTIQRELLAFVSVGTLKRVGERRWSRYSLK